MKKIILLLIFTLNLTNSQETQFGKNKVQYKNFSWSYIQSKHFDIYFYDGGEYIAQFTAFAAESSYAKIKSSFKYSISHRIPIMVYNSHNDFQQTNIISEYLEEGIGGVTELFKNRVVLPFEGSYKMFRHVIHHELVHAVLNEMFYGGSIQNLISSGSRLQLPGWFNEGLAEFEALGWDANSDMFMRDATINTYLPPINYLDGYFAYRGGQAVWFYISQKYGSDKIAEILHRIKGLGNVEQGFKSELGLTLKELDEKWQKELKVYYWPDVAKRVEPDDFATQITNHTKKGNFYNTSPAISPQGDKIVFISDMEDYFDIYLYQIHDEKITKLIDGQRTSNFEELHLLTPGITWSPDGKQIAFSVKSGQQDAIFIVDIKTKIQKKLTLNLDGIFSVDWSKDGNYLTFTGNNAKQSDIYIYDLKNSNLTNLTNDIFTDSDPTWSTDGDKIYFVSDRRNNVDPLNYPKKMWEYDFSQQDIYSFEVKNKIITKLIVNSESNETSPQISSDGKNLFFISDKNGINNIYQYNFEKGITTPITNSLTGIYQLSLSVENNKIVFSSLHEAGFDIFLLQNLNTSSQPQKELEITEYLKRFLAELKIENDTTGNLNDDKKYIPTPFGDEFVFENTPLKIKKDSIKITSLLPKTSDKNIVNVLNNLDEYGNFIANDYKISFSPDIIYGNAAFNTFYGAQGTTVMAFSDLLGDHQIYFVSNLLLDLKNSDYQLAYFYLPELIDYGIEAFHTARFLYLYDKDGYQTLYRFRSYGLTAVASIPFDKFNRIEANTTFMNLTKENQSYVDVENDQNRFTFLPSLSFVHDNTLWGYTSPNNGSKFNLTLTSSPISSNKSLKFTTITADFRKYWRILQENTFVFRGSSGISFGKDAQHFFIGGTDGWINREFENGGIPIENVEDYAFLSPVYPMRGWNFNTLNGTKYALINLEYRFPLIRLLVTGGIPMAFQNITGVLFADLGTAWTDEEQFKGFALDENLNRIRKDFLGSLGVGSRVILFGLPLKIDVAWSYLGEDFSTPRYLFSLGTDF